MAAAASPSCPPQIKTSQEPFAGSFVVLWALRPAQLPPFTLAPSPEARLCSPGSLALNQPPILLVDDEPLILEFLHDALADGGYSVESASSAEAALEMLDGHRALVTDVNLGRGKLTGWDLAHRARTARPDLAVVYITGESAFQWSSKGVLGSKVLCKPCAPSQVLDAVSGLLFNSR
jgi:CheY-like chemotaxis protein